MTREIKKCTKCNYYPGEMKRIYARVYEDSNENDKYGRPKRKQIFKPIGWIHTQCGFTNITGLVSGSTYKGKLRS